MEQNIRPLQEKTEKLLQVVDKLTARNTWPRRPIPWRENYRKVSSNSSESLESHNAHWGKMTHFVQKFKLTSNDLIGLNWPQMALNGLSRSWIFGQKWVFCHSVQSEEKLLDSRENTRLQNCCITRKHLRIFLLFPLFFDFLKLLRYSISICMNKTPICIQKNS